jgi:crotonobetaine/carnitine-CoA ligase
VADELQERTLGAVLAAAAERAPSRAFVTFDDKTVSYAGAVKQVERHAAAFASVGIGRGDRVAILLPNGLPFVWTWLGLSCLGAIEVPLNTGFRSRQIVRALEAADARILIADARFAPVVNEVAEAARLDSVLTEGDSGAFDATNATVQGLDELLTAAGPFLAPVTRVTGRDLVAILPTSGTTGLPKGVMLCHNHEVVLGRNIARVMDLRASDVFYNFFPFFHNAAQGIITVACLFTGAHMVLTERFSASRFWSDVEAYGCTAFYYMGAILKILLKQAKHEPTPRSTPLRIGWGIAADDRELEAFSERFGVKLAGGYGSTEANVPVLFRAGEKKPGSAGRVIEGWQVEIVDEEDRVLPPNTLGEIVVRSQEPYTIMQGYFNAPEETVRAWRNLWFHTGDAGFKDDEDNLFFVDRIGDVIRRRGETISSVEIEEALLGVPGVVEVAAIPVPADLGEDEVKVVMVGDREAVSYSAIIAHCERLLPAFAVPRYLEWTDDLPKTETGKVRKQELRKAPFSNSTWDREKEKDSSPQVETGN